MTDELRMKYGRVSFLNDYAWYLMQEKDYETLKGVESEITALLDEIDKMRNGEQN